MQVMWCLLPFICMAVVAGFPWQTPAQTPCPREVQCVPDGVLTVTFSVSGDTAPFRRAREQPAPVLRVSVLERTEGSCRRTTGTQGE